jgi:hypothetical protein
MQILASTFNSDGVSTPRFDMSHLDASNFGPVLMATLRLQAKLNEQANAAAFAMVAANVRNDEKSKSNSTARQTMLQALDNPHSTRQSLLAAAIRQGNDANIKDAASKIIKDIAPGAVMDEQLKPVISAAKAAVEYSKQAQSSKASASAEPVVIKKDTCRFDAALWKSIPESCTVYTLNYYGIDGVNNFYRINVNGALVPVSSKAVQVKGPVRWSITYACPKAAVKDAGKDAAKMTPVPGSASGAVPAQPAAAGAPVPPKAATTQAAPSSSASGNASNAVPGAKKAEPILDEPVTLSGLMCDAKGLKDSKGRLVKKFQMSNNKILLQS